MKKPSPENWCVALAALTLVVLLVPLFWTVVLIYVLMEQGSQLVTFAGEAAVRSREITAGIEQASSSAWVQLLLGTCFGLAGALFIERAKTPRLKLTAAEHADHAQENMRSIHVLVTHVPPWIVFRWFLLSSPAPACQAALRFLDDQGVEEFVTPFEARWTASQQPPEFLNNGLIAPSVFEMLKKRDVFPGIPEKLDICVKFGGEADCFVFSNRSYVAAGHYKDNQFRLPPGIFVVVVSVAFAERTTTAHFRVRNDLPKDQFRLETL